MALLIRNLRPSALFFLLLTIATVAIAQGNANVTVVNDSTKYKYYGCYNETTQIPGSAGTRALDGGINEVKQGEMTVPMCLAFCGNGNTQYRYAGLEWSRECWCAQELAGIAQKLDDTACNFPCEGNKTTACGGALKLTVYRVSAASSVLESKMLLVAGVFMAVYLS